MTITPTFTCPDCRRVSHHPMDVHNSYCGNCNAYKWETYFEPRCMEPYCPRFGSYDMSRCPDVHSIPPFKRN